MTIVKLKKQFSEELMNYKEEVLSMENDMVTKEFLKYIVETLVDNANDTINELREKPNDDFLEGKKLAYYEMLDSIKSRLEVREENLAEYGLNFDIEKMLL